MYTFECDIYFVFANQCTLTNSYVCSEEKKFSHFLTMDSSVCPRVQGIPVYDRVQRVRQVPDI